MSISHKQSDIMIDTQNATDMKDVKVLTEISLEEMERLIGKSKAEILKAKITKFLLLNQK